MFLTQRGRHNERFTVHQNFPPHLFHSKRSVSKARSKTRHSLTFLILFSSSQLSYLMRIADILTSPADGADSNVDGVGDGHFTMISTRANCGRHPKLHRTFRRMIHSCRRSLLKTTKKSGKEKEPDRTVKISVTGSDSVASSSACSVSLPAVFGNN